MTADHIRFAPDILRRLGEELNPAIDQGMLELVKNAYDADAHACTIELLDVNKPGGAITIRDDGDGMTRAQLRNGWLVVGSSQKTAMKRTALGRVPAGTKGLGRLAALRLGLLADCITRPRSQPSRQYSLTIDWSKFANVSVVEDVTLSVVSSTRKANANHGTEVRLRGLRRSISRDEILSLARALVLLADPFDEDPAAFVPRLLVPEFADLEATVSNRFFSEAEYHLIATVDGSGHSAAKVLDHRGGILYQTKALSAAEYQCPSAQFDLWTFKRTGARFMTRNANPSDVKSWINSFGGVHVYVDGLRVQPYGNRGDDWLQLNLRRVRSPEERPSTNNSIGRVAVQDIRGDLAQKTDRSGFIETRAFLELRRFGEDALDWMSRERLKTVERDRSLQRTHAVSQSTRAAGQLEKAIAAVPRAPAELGRAFRRLERARRQEERRLLREVQLYRTLSTAGITAATFAHETDRTTLKVMEMAIIAVERRAKRYVEDYATHLEEPITSLRNSLDSLARLSGLTLRLLERDKRDIIRVDVHDVIRRLSADFAPLFERRGATYELELFGGDPYLRTSQAAVESILANLLTNSLNALRRRRQSPRRVLVRTAVMMPLTLTVTVADNGPGIIGLSAEEIWLPGQSTEAGGTGFGLTIVRDTVHDLGGEASVIEHGVLGGAEFRVTIPVLGN